jgi:hypothetical protein
VRREQPEKKWPADHCRDDTHRHFNRGQYRSCDGVTRDQKCGASKQRGGKHETMVCANEESYEVRDDDSDKANWSAE